MSQSRSRKPANFVPTFDLLENRLVPASIDPQGPTLVITGNDKADRIVITDFGGGHVKVQAGKATSDVTGVNTIQINTKGGKDNVDYTLAGDVTQTMNVTANLGKDNDTFTAHLTGHSLTAGTLDFTVNGQDGDDTVRIDASVGTNLASGTSLGVALNGGAGRDTLFVPFNGNISQNAGLQVNMSGGGDRDNLKTTYSGKNDGSIVLGMSGDADRDTLDAEVTLGAGSTGGVGRSDNPALLQGGTGNDTMTFLVRTPPGSAPVFASVLGQGGTDTFTRTANVSSDAAVPGEADGVVA
jgi:hypothetical protein